MIHPRLSSTTTLTGALWLVFLAIAATAYASGLGAGLMFDDYPNLEGLEQFQDGAWLYHSLQYSLNGVSSSLGRPLALLSFAAQDASWPKHPDDFLQVNALLHLLNGCLLFWTLHLLIRLRGLAPSANLHAAIIAGLWLILPIHVSTVLYIVQRMTVLSTTFMLAGFLLYLGGRLQGRDPRRAGRSLILMSLGLFTGTILGVLAKENAALFPLLILIIEGLLLNTVARPAFMRWWYPLAVYAPLALLAGYLLFTLPATLGTYVVRDFGLQDRLLTQARLLFEYLHTMLLPGLGTGRIYFDDYPISRTLFEPVSTLLACLGVLGLTGLAIALRQRARAFSFALAWFGACHALESSFLPLELGFEHRNYLAAAGILAGAYVLAAQALASPPLSERLRRILLGVAVGYVLFLMAALHASTRLWGDPLNRAAYWHTTQPESRRAARGYAEALLRKGRYPEAIEIYERAARRWPDDASLSSARINIGCVLENVVLPSSDEFRRQLASNSGNGLAVLGDLINVLTIEAKSGCPYIERGRLEDYFELALQSPLTRFHEASVLALRARIAASSGNYRLASELMARAAQRKPKFAVFKDAILYALNAGDLAAAERLQAQLESEPRLSAVHRWTYRLEIQGMRQLLSLYAQARPGDGDGLAD